MTMKRPRLGTMTPGSEGKTLQELIEKAKENARSIHEGRFQAVYRVDILASSHMEGHVSVNVSEGRKRPRKKVKS